MADAQKNTALTEEKRDNNVYRSYNYVGTKETVAYLFNDWSNTFNINGYKGRFVWDVVKIDFGINAIVGITYSFGNEAIKPIKKKKSIAEKAQ